MLNKVKEEFNWEHYFYKYLKIKLEYINLVNALAYQGFLFQPVFKMRDVTTSPNDISTI